MPNKKKEILKRLKYTYCRLRSSAIQGIGIFAIRDIPAGINPFKGIAKQQWHRFNVSQLKKLDRGVLKMINDFYVTEKDGTIPIPEYALNGMDISFFLNNSKTPNLQIINGGLAFTTLRKIKKGEELTVAYATYDYKYKKDKLSK